MKAGQTNENWIAHKQMLAGTLSTPVVLLQMSECSIFVFAVIFPVLTHWFSTAPDACKENFVSAAIRKNALLNERPLAFETAFFVRAAVTAFIICLNTKKERVIKAHWWLDLRVALYSRIEMLKAHTFFQICHCNSGPFWQCCFAQSDMLEKILAKLVSWILRKCLTYFYQRRFSVMLPEHLQDWK